MIKIHTLCFFLALSLFEILPFSGFASSQNPADSTIIRELIIENFDDGTVELFSYPGEDQDPGGWALNSGITYQNSPYSLKLTGNTWKMQNIQAVTVDSGDVWQVSAYIQSDAEIQGFGVMDDSHSMFYSFAGTEGLNSPEWLPVYQGCFSKNQWNIYQLPIGDDWLAKYGYLPEIVSVVYVNDKDATSIGVAYFDLIMDITGDLPVVPKVSINYLNTRKKGRGTEYQFLSQVIDPDSEDHDYFWDFGDGSTSNDQNPLHTFSISDDHPYTVMLQVSDETNKWGRASCKVEVEPGESSFPVTLNFVGDIMLARKYEESGGIIPTLGVEAIFEPIKPYLSDSADITIANLECPLTTYWIHHPTKSIYFKGSPDNADGLVYAGIDVVTLANNHTMDYMTQGMQETQSVLKERDILFSGSGADAYEASRPVFYSKKGVNFAFLASSDRTGQYNNYQPYLDAGYNKPGFANLTEYHFTKQISEVKDVSDLLIMEFHSGVEYSYAPGEKDLTALAFAGGSNMEEDYSPVANAPSGYNREIRHAAIDDGADLVICHHPHIAHGVELYKGKLIAHSLGDFTFDLVYPETFPSMILNAQANDTGFYGFEITPVFLDDFIPVRTTGEMGLYILDYYSRLSRDLDTYLKVDRENVIATVIMDTSAMTTREIANSAILPMSFSSGNYQSPPLRLAKTGSLTSVDDIQPTGSYSFRPGRETLWFGNMENEGCTMWYLNNSNEVYCDTASYTGSRSLQHRREASSPYNLVTNLEQRIVCLSDTLKYTLCGYVKTENGNEVTVEILCYEDREGGILLSQENFGMLITGTTPWTFYSRNLNIPTGTKYFDVRLVSGIPASGTAYSWFDNVSLICWDNWTEAETAAAIPFPNDYYFLQIRSPQNPGEIMVEYTETVFDDQTVGVDQPEKPKVLTSGLTPNYPNPFNPETGPTNFSILLTDPGFVEVRVIDFLGRKVKVLTSSHLQPGAHQITWDGRNESGEFVDSGIYFFELVNQHQIKVNKGLVVR